MRINWKTDKGNQTAGHERDVNFTWIGQILLENKCTIWYNIDTERNVAPRSLVRRSELPASDVTRGCAEISADVSDERSIMAWVCFCDCRKVARLQWLQGEDVLFAACGGATFRIFYFGGQNHEKETSSKQRPQMSVLWQSFDSQKCGRNLPP